VRPVTDEIIHVAEQFVEQEQTILSRNPDHPEGSDRLQLFVAHALQDEQHQPLSSRSASHADAMSGMQRVDVQ